MLSMPVVWATAAIAKESAAISERVETGFISVSFGEEKARGPLRATGVFKAIGASGRAQERLCSVNGRCGHARPVTRAVERATNSLHRPLASLDLCLVALLALLALLA